MIISWAGLVKDVDSVADGRHNSSQKLLNIMERLEA